MDKNLAQLNRNIARLRREIRVAGWEMQQLIDADLDCTGVARVLMHMQTDLKLFIEKREQCAEKVS